MSGRMDEERASYCSGELLRSLPSCKEAFSAVPLVGNEEGLNQDRSYGSDKEGGWMVRAHRKTGCLRSEG